MDQVYSVSQVNAYIKGLFEQDYMMRRISVSGEVSNCTYHRSGHIYFTLKDARAQISCVMFASARRGLAFHMQAGDSVVVGGTIDVYERDGRYQLYASTITREGAGVLYERFLAKKQELEEMGMFAPMYKQPIPAHVRTLGIVTAPTGAAIRDIRNIVLRRNPSVQLILYPARVQGEGAAEEIARGIAVLDALKPDCIIAGRGGGSIEDLWAFNEEVVARAIFDCRTPLISAVGHETDTTIADLVADLRAPTPSAAAELAVADLASVLDRIARAERRLQLAMAGHLGAAKEALAQRMQQWRLRSPMQRVASQKERLAKLMQRMRTASEAAILGKRHRLQLLLARFRGLSPLEKLNQGYAKLTAGGNAISSISDINEGDMLRIYLQDGRIDARAESKEAIDFITEEI